MSVNQSNLASFTDILGDEISNSQPLSLPSSNDCSYESPVKENSIVETILSKRRPPKCAGQHGEFRSVEEIDPKYRHVFTYPFFNLVQSKVIEDALYSDKSIVVCAPTGSGKTVVFEMAIVQLLMELEDQQCNDDFKIIYMAPVKALCTEKLTEWYPKLTKLGLLCIEVTGDTDVDFSQLKPYRMIITTPEKWDMLTRRWRDHKSLVEMVKLFLIDEVHILNDESRGPVLEAVVSRMKTIESSAQSTHRIEQLQQKLQGGVVSKRSRPRIRFVAVSATVGNPEDVAAWLGTDDKPAVYYKFGDECRPVKLKRVVEGYPCPEGTSIFKFDIILNYKLWPIIQRHHSGKPTLIFCNTRKSVALTAETLSRELTINFNPEQKAKLTALASTIKNKKLQSLVMSGVGCHHAGLLFEERMNIERAFRNRDLPILITTTTLAMGVNLPAHLVIVKNTQQYVNGAYQEYSISTVLQMVGRAGRPQFDTEATAVIMTRLADKPRYQSLVGGSEPLQSYLHKRLAENLNSEAALGTVGDVAQCVQWLRSTFLFVRAARDPRRYLSLPQNSPQHLISKKIEELCVKAMNGLASSGLITMDEASCIESTEAGRLMSIFYLDLETMKHIMKIEGSESLERLLWLICESHELADMHLRMDERRCLNALNRNNSAATIRYPMKGKITTRQMKLNCVIQATLGCLPIPDPSLGQEAMKIMRIADRVCKCLVAYVIRPDPMSHQAQFYSAVLNSLTLAKCIAAHLWENSPYLSKQLKGIGPTFSTLLASAGKTNFMLLQESHPRDLERIINKGPPAGNVIRKQISLLPKYQLTISPVDERTISLELLLVNHSYLSENMDNLTAGEHHKSYIAVGDSSNHLLLLTSFKDKDLISIYDGTIKYELKRKNDSEHKIFAHCISSTFVGIDAHAEYLFNNLSHLLPPAYPTSCKNIPAKNTTKKQTCITDTFKERKRKNTNDVTQSKEKRKRDIAVIENFKALKEAFGFCKKEPKVHVKEVRQKIEEFSNEELSKPNNFIDITEKNVVPVNSDGRDVNSLQVNVDDIDDEEYIDDAQIDSILLDIENEISKVKTNTNNSMVTIDVKNIHSPNAIKTAPMKFNDADDLKLCKKRKLKPISNKTNNYNFINLLDRNMDLCDDEEDLVKAPKHNGFSETIKCHINKYLQNTQNQTKLPDSNIKQLLEDAEKTNRYDKLEKVDPVGVLNKELKHSSGLDNIPYKVKEILEPMEPTEQLYLTDREFKEKMVNTEDDKHDEMKDKYLNNTDTFENNAHTKRQQVDSDVLVTEFSPTLEHPIKIGIHSENKENIEYVKQSNDDVRGKNNIIHPENMNIKNTENKIQTEWKSVELRNSKGNNEKFNGTRPQHSIGPLVLFNRTNNTNIADASDNDTIYGIRENHLPKLKLPSVNILSHGNVVDHSYSTVSLGPFENKTIVQRKTKDTSIYDFNVELRCEKSHNNIPIKNYCDKEQNYPVNNAFSNSLISSLSRNNLDEGEECINNNYSFTAIKVDTCTKDSVKIVRKVKVDLNISEIISLKKVGYKSDKQYERQDQTKCIQLLNSTPQQYIKTSNESEKTWKKEIEPKDHCTETSLDLEFNALKYEYGFNNKDEFKDRTFEVEIQDDIKLNKYKETDQLCGISKEHVVDTKPSKSQSLEERNKDSDHVNCEYQPNTENSRIKNILGKYSNIFGKLLTEPIAPVLPPDTKDGSISNRKDSEVKFNRPFKISEIHQLQVQLPNTLIDVQPTSNNVSITEMKTNVDILRQNTAESIPQHYGQCNGDGDKDRILEYESSNLEMLDLPVDVEFKSTDFEIDNSMFDPKTLLQCVVESDIDEIIPPPQQFCDGTDYSADDVHEIRMSKNYNQWCADSENNSAVDIDAIRYVDNVDANIFKDNCDEQLTPSKEIETWTLSREDSWEKLAANPITSFTVIRKNTPDNDEPEPPLPRRMRLNKFKFNDKDRFKIRR